MFKVDKGVVMPPRSKTGSASLAHVRELLSQMSVGDSVEASLITAPNGSFYSPTLNNFRLLGKNEFGYKMSTRTDRKNMTRRIWRVE